MQQRIAIIGSGIAGLTTASLLSQRYEVSLFEAQENLGGHTNTQAVTLDGFSYQIDTGFIVFNKKTYPNFCQLLKRHHIPIQESEMSFSYRSDQYGMEYNGHNLNALFCDRRNIVKPRFYRFIKQIVKFNGDAKLFLSKSSDYSMTIAEFIDRHEYSADFVNFYLLPMLSAIWSKQKTEVLHCQAHFIFAFYENHGLLNTYQRPQWYVLKNGSKNYIQPLIKYLQENIYLNTEIKQVERHAQGVTLRSAADEFYFDKVVIATHSDQALQMLTNPTNDEVTTLSAITYTENDVTLHTDASIMPKRKLGWASWNYYDNGSHLPTLTYYMNRLQSIKSAHPFLVSVNLNQEIAAEKVIKRFRYAHPCLNLGAIKAQKNIDQINGVHHVYYAGSYWGNGFHEDGVNSAIRTCRLLGIDYA